MKEKEKGALPITDSNMTRFNITLEEGVDLVLYSLKNAWGSEIFIPKIPSYNIIDLAKAIGGENCKINITGIRPGEKIHEQMIGLEDAPHTYEYDDHYKILPAIYNWSSDPERNKGGVKVDKNFTYSSDNNKEWMSVGELKEWIDANKSKIGKI